MKKLRAFLLTLFFVAPALAQERVFPPASQAEVIEGLTHNKFVAPDTLAGFPFIATNLPLTSLTNTVNAQIANGTQPLRPVINVKAPPYNAKGDGVADDWVAIQSALTAAALTNSGPVGVYIPAGTYRLTNTLALTTQTNVGIGVTGNTSLSELYGDGGRRTVLQFTNASGNGLEFRVITNDPRHLSNFSVHDLALLGPAVAGTTNVSGSGFFFGYNADLPYVGDTTGWGDAIYNCLVMGWRNGLCITNTVFFTARNCNFQSNILHSVLLAHADTTRLENNLYGFSVVDTNDLSAIAVWPDVSGIAGAGVISIGGECGNSAYFASVIGGLFNQYGGNFERNNSMLIASNLCHISFQGCRIVEAPPANYFTFNFLDGAASDFWGADCMIDTTNVFFQATGALGTEFPIHHALRVVVPNGMVNSTPTSYPPVYFQTPRWSHSYQLAECVNLNATALTPLSTSPTPFFSADGLSVNTTTGELWLPIPSGLGNNENDLNREDVRFTLLIQGGTGATNAQLTLNTFANRKNPATGDASDESPSFTVPGITNAACKVYSWTNHWNATTAATPRFLRLHVVTTNQIYLIGLNAQTVDF